MPPTSTPRPGPDAGADVSTMSYEQARDDLIAVVARLEAGGATLEESLALWERGEALATRCQEWLDGARRRLAAAHAGDPTTGTTGTDTGTTTDTDTDTDTDEETRS